jgi:hypothetical protein
MTTFIKKHGIVGEIILKINITMVQKTIWMRYLIIGISCIFVSSLYNCTSETSEDFLVKADFIFVNETNYEIEIISVTNPFKVSPMQKFTINQEGMGSGTIDEDSYVPPFLSGIEKYDNIKCNILDAGVKAGRGEGPAGIQNYESKKIAERHYEFTYRFQEDDYNNANDNCE